MRPRVTAGCAFDPDAVRSSCQASVSARASRWLAIGSLVAVALLAGRSDSAGAGNHGGSPVLVARLTGTMLVLGERPGSEVSRFEVLPCPRSPNVTGIYGWDWITAVAPDPTLLAFSCVHDDFARLSSTGTLILTDARGGRTVAGAGPGQVPNYPVWSRRSRAVAYVGDSRACAFDGRQRRPAIDLLPAIDLFVVRPGGSERLVARLADGGVTEARVEDWSPTGTAVLAVVSRYDGECRVMAHLGDSLAVVTTD